MRRINQNAKTIEALNEVFKMSCYLGVVVDIMGKDCKQKAKIIRALIPLAVFKVGPEKTETALQLLLDRWNYQEPQVTLR